MHEIKRCVLEMARKLSKNSNIFIVIQTNTCKFRAHQIESGAIEI